MSEAKGRLESAGEQDNAFVNMLLLTALRHLVYIRKIIKQYVRKKLPTQSAFAQYALILGITEALYLDTPDYALINSYVDIVKNNSTNMLQALSMPFCAKCALPETSCKRLTAANFFRRSFTKYSAAATETKPYEK